MEYNSESEKLFYLYTLKYPKYFEKVHKKYFRNKEIGILFDFSKKFFEKFKESTSKDQVKTLIKQTRHKDELSSDLIDEAFNVNLLEYDESWLDESLKSWVKFKSLEESLITSIEYVKSNQINTDNIDSVVEKVRSIVQEKNNVNFDNSFGVNFANAEDHQFDFATRMPSGKKFYDRLAGGGYDPKTLVVYAGEQNIGKSIWLANDAAHFFRQGKNVAVISGEMSDKKFMKRIGSNILDVHIDDYESWATDVAKVQKRINGVMETSLTVPGDLHVKQLAAPTVPQVEMYLKEYEEKMGINLNVIVIDYINILTNYRNPNSENTYLKVKQIAEDLRSMAIRNNWLIISATQLNKGGWDSSNITMSDIAESAGLSHTADTIFAIIQDREMLGNGEYWLKILKIRDGGGKNTKALFKIDFSRMRISETDTIAPPSLV